MIWSIEMDLEGQAMLELLSGELKLRPWRGRAVRQRKDDDVFFTGSSRRSQQLSKNYVQSIAANTVVGVLYYIPGPKAGTVKPLLECPLSKQTSLDQLGRMSWKQDKVEKWF